MSLATPVIRGTSINTAWLEGTPDRAGSGPAVMTTTGCAPGWRSELSGMSTVRRSLVIDVMPWLASNFPMRTRVPALLRFVPAKISVSPIEANG